MAAKQTLMCLVRSKNRRCFCPIGNRLLSVSSCQRREVFTALDHILGWDPATPCWQSVVPMYIEPKKSQRYISTFASHHWTSENKSQSQHRLEIQMSPDLLNAHLVNNKKKKVLDCLSYDFCLLVEPSSMCDGVCLRMCECVLVCMWMCVSVPVRVSVCMHMCVCLLHNPITDHIQLHYSCTFVLHCLLLRHNPSVLGWNQWHYLSTDITHCYSARRG